MEETALPVTFGEWLKHRRRELDLTQAELARRAGCSVFALRKIEIGERRPSKQLAGLLAQSLEIPSEDQPTFVRVARGELSVERLHSTVPVRTAHIDVEQPLSISEINLPVHLNPLVGREVELAALGKLLLGPHCRLLTITGLGGIGKTRLAVELASNQRAMFPGGVYYVSLASLSSPDFIIPAIADILGLSLSGPLDPQEQLFNYLASRARQPILVFLDNLEHLLNTSTQMGKKSGVAILLAELLQRVPNMKILATSCERINIQGEWNFELQGLPCPPSDQSDSLEDYSAAVLFLQRARQAKADFVILPEERLSLARVCQLVEGAPLALELAAAWVGMLSVDEIAHEIESNLDFLTTSVRDIPERHRSLRATFHHSWKLLSAEEQRGLCQLSVFRGGFQREAAEQVAGANLPILMSLFSKSLLLRKENGRYDLHEVVRQYALAYLAEDPQSDATCDRHCKFYLGLVRGREKGFGEATRWNAVQTLTDELDNLRAAMAWGLEKYGAECTLQIAIALGQYWLTHGYLREGLEWLERGLDDPGPISNVVRAKALTVAGKLTRYLGNYPRAISLLQESLTLWGRCEDQTGIAQTFCNLGTAVYHQGDREGAIRLLEKSLSLAKQQDDQRGKYCSLENLGHAAADQGDKLRAIELYNESLALALKAGDDDQAAKLLNHLGGEYTLQGDYDRAEECFGIAAKICQRLGNRVVGAYISSNRGFVALKQGNYSKAFELLVEAIIALQEVGSREEALLCLEPIACIAKEQGDPDRAARLLGSSVSLRKGMGVVHRPSTKPDYEACLASLRSQLGEAAFEAAWANGSRMTFEQAISYAVSISE